jgi:16S rRNA G527 N7-methylase RsmG
LLYHFGEFGVRDGVKKLSDEFNSTVNVESNDSVRKWYEDTDYYIFDLLPWNGCGMFLDKLKLMKNVVEHEKSKTVIDFGGGLGISAIYMSQELNLDHIYYVDLKNSKTFAFASFLIKKLGITNITILGDSELFSSDIKADIIISNDCFEHIKNLEETTDKLIKHSNTLFHQSTFVSDHNTPQHIQNKGDMWFLKMMASKNFVIKGHPLLLNRIEIDYTLDENKNLYPTLVYV